MNALSLTDPAHQATAFRGLGTTSLTLTTGGLAQYTTINIVDADAGAAVTFGNSGAVAYATNFNIALGDPGAGPISFTGTSNFGAYNLQAATKRNIAINNATVEAGAGNITLQANQGATPTLGGFVGISIGNATVQSTGSGAITLQGRGGVGGASYGVSLGTFGKVIGGTGDLTISGTGGASPTGNAYGVYLAGSSPTITSSGGNVHVTGQGGGTSTSSGEHRSQCSCQRNHIRSEYGNCYRPGNGWSNHGRWGLRNTHRGRDNIKRRRRANYRRRGNQGTDRQCPWRLYCRPSSADRHRRP